MATTYTSPILIDNPSESDIELAKVVVANYLKEHKPDGGTVPASSIAVLVDRKLGRNMYSQTYPYCELVPEGWVAKFKEERVSWDKLKAGMVVSSPHGKRIIERVSPHNGKPESHWNGKRALEITFTTWEMMLAKPGETYFVWEN